MQNQSMRSSMRQRNSQTVKTEEKILKLGETLFSCNIYKGDGIYLHITLGAELFRVCRFSIFEHAQVAH